MEAVDWEGGLYVGHRVAHAAGPAGTHGPARGRRRRHGRRRRARGRERGRERGRRGLRRARGLQGAHEGRRRPLAFARTRVLRDESAVHLKRAVLLPRAIIQLWQDVDAALRRRHVDALAALDLGPPVVCPVDRQDERAAAGDGERPELALGTGAGGVCSGAAGWRREGRRDGGQRQGEQPPPGGRALRSGRIKRRVRRDEWKM